MPGCRRALRWLGSQLLCRRCQVDCPEPMRTSQRNLHHQLLRSGVLIFLNRTDGSSRRLRPYAGVRPGCFLFPIGAHGHAGLDLERITCACPTRTEGTPRCNYGRSCGTLKARGEDVGAMLIAERLARSVVCGRTSCAPRESWCPSRNRCYLCCFESRAR
jgi:hypothetical protein